MRILYLVLMLFVATVGHAREKHALIIGIGQYLDPNWSHIHADADIEYAEKMLRANGFEDIRILKNEQATKQAIIEAFMRLADECSIGDKVYIHFSGHGQQITDINGDEPYGLDETWAPYDAHPFPSADYHGENHLVDDEINVLLAAIKQSVGKKGRIVVVVDACHSQSSTREQSDNYRGFDKPFIIEDVKPLPLQASVPEEWITISACLDYQVNWEIVNPKMGKLTWSLYKLRNKLSRMSNRELEKSIDDIMRKYHSPLEQNPSITGVKDSEAVKDIFN